MASVPLHRLLEDSARRHPHRPAVEEPAPPEGGAAVITYRDLDALSDRVRDRLRGLGVGPNHRVGTYLRKSIDGVAAILGILKTGAAYVPVDPGAPPARGAYILTDCGVSAVFVEDRFADRLRNEIEKLGSVPAFVVLPGAGGGQPLAAALDREQASAPVSSTVSADSGPDELAYVLYTSGSTGRPKGVALSHLAATSFVDWCSEVFAPTHEDRFSSHAPFHFDLSILDLYVPLRHGAAVVLIGEEVGKEPARLAPLIAEQRISVWYSAPSILALLAQYGALETRSYDALRLVLFAGEVFPIKHLRALYRLLPRPRYFNLYGPTETNVCTYYEVPTPIPEERSTPYPIGRACSHLTTRVLDAGGREVPRGSEGELCVAGAGVMQGYWNLPENTERAFIVDGTGLRWYRTGDVVAEDMAGDYIFLGRRDRMVKRRGYRVELGEIETGLYRHPAVKEAAVIAASGAEGEVRILAFVACHEDAKRPSLVALKRHCAENLPIYMVPDLVSFQDALPKTSTDKIDYQRLRELT